MRAGVAAGFGLHRVLLAVVRDVRGSFLIRARTKPGRRARSAAARSEAQGQHRDVVSCLRSAEHGFVQRLGFVADDRVCRQPRRTGEQAPLPLRHVALVLEQSVSI